MKIPSSYEKTHWGLFNLLAKVFCGGLIIVSVIFLLTTFLDSTGSGAWYPEEMKIINYVVFPVLGVLGYFGFKAKPYYPKEFHEYYKSIGKIEEETKGN